MTMPTPILVRRLLYGAVAALALLLAVAPRHDHAAQGQEVMRIAAVVNDQVISIYDLAARIEVVIASSGLTDSPALRRQLAPQVLRALVNELLQRQEAERLEITISDEEMDRAIAQVERQNKLQPGDLEKFIQARRLDRKSVLDQISAEIFWTKVIRRRMGGTISVGEDEIDEALARLEANKGRPEYRVAEIFLAVDAPEREAEVRRTADNLVTQLRAGARFAAIAQQFSQSATSAVGGDIGWLVAGQLLKEIDQALIKLEPGQISDAIRTFEGFYVVTLLDRRTALTANPLDTLVHLAQIVVTPGAGEPREPFEQLNALRREVEGCPALLNRAKEIASPLSGDLGTVRLGDLPTDIRDAVKDLTAGQTSQPLSFEQGVRTFMVCDRTEAEVALPDRSLIRQDIGSRRMELLARRYLRDLRRSSFVDFRL